MRYVTIIACYCLLVMESIKVEVQYFVILLLLHTYNYHDQRLKFSLLLEYLGLCYVQRKVCMLIIMNDVEEIC